MKLTKKKGRATSGSSKAGSSVDSGAEGSSSKRSGAGTSRTSAGGRGKSMTASNTKSAAPAKRKASPAKELKRREAEAPAAALEQAQKGMAKKSKVILEESPTSTKLPSDSARQRVAEGRVKVSKIKGAGLDSRLLGHVSGSGKRNQARRDSKN